MDKIEDLKEEIAGYCRISVDDDLDNDNTSIENQKDIINHYVKKYFPKCRLTFYEDRDKSGYTFEQREDYQRLRKRMMNGEIKILIVKDFSRFARRNSKGLVELEDLRDAGVRIISIGDLIDYPTHDDWTAIQFRFLINEMPVTDTSKKVKSVIKRRQEDGEWVCVVPYGYMMINAKKGIFKIEPEEAQVVKKIYELYNNGWGYKKIANYLTDQNIPTPRMKEKERAEEKGLDYKRKCNSVWSIITVSGILTNDFYIGTLRQHKYQRKKIHGVDVKLAEEEHIVFEKHHPAIIDDRTYLYTQEQLKLRTKSNYRGIKKYDTAYSGFLFCADCGAPMFSMSRNDIAPAYTCGTYHKRGLKGCTSHHIRVDFLDEMLKDFVRMVKDNSADMIEQLEKTIAEETEAVKTNDNIIEVLTNKLESTKAELKTTKRRKIKDISKDPDNEELIEETYAEIEQELMDRIYGLQNQIQSSSDKRNDIIQVNRVAKTVIEVFDRILSKEKLDKIDISLIVDKIMVKADGSIEVHLKSDIDTLLKIGTLPNKEVLPNFNFDSINNLLTTQYTQKARNQRAKVYTVNVISSGDPLEIFTDREGEIILKKYSPIGELSQFAGQYAESLAQSTGHLVCITDRDHVIAAAGNGKKEFEGKPISRQLEELIEDRKNILAQQGDSKFVRITLDDTGNYHDQAISTIICEGDAIGAVVLYEKNETAKMGETESKLAITAAGFLGRQMEQ